MLRRLTPRWRFAQARRCNRFVKLSRHPRHDRTRFSYAASAVVGIAQHHMQACEPVAARRRRRRGILVDLDAAHEAVRLTRLHRFTDPDEAAATLQVRAGDIGAVDFYLDRDRIKIGDPATLADRILAAWQHDQDQGLDSLMLAPSRRQVADLQNR
jgi:hypothetical protein